MMLDRIKWQRRIHVANPNYFVENLGTKAFAFVVVLH